MQHALDYLCFELLERGVRMRACLGLQCSVASISSLFSGRPLWVPLQKKNLGLHPPFCKLCGKVPAFYPTSC